MFCVCLLNGCSYNYSPQGIDDISIEVAIVSDISKLKQSGYRSSLQFQQFENGSLVDFDFDYKLFKISAITQFDVPRTILILPHYFREVLYFDQSFKLLDSVKRNNYKKSRDYSTNIIAFDMKKEDSFFYIMVKNDKTRKLLFTLEEQLLVRSYDQKLSFTFVAVYASIFTLFIINLIFYFYIRKQTYLYYALYLFFSLFALFFQEGFIAYFSNLSSHFLGTYTQMFWLKIPVIFFWLFILKFLDLKRRSLFDFKLVKFLFFLDVLMLSSMVLFDVFELDKISVYVSLFINFHALISIFLLFYLAIKYVSLNVSLAKYLLIGWLAYYGTLIVRVIYTLNVEPTAFWMPRAFEFGLLINALALSFGLADKTLRVIQDKNQVQKTIETKERTLFCNELVKTYQIRANHRIEKHYGTEKVITNIINNLFVSTIMQLIDVKDVFYIHEKNEKLGLQKISSSKLGFNITDFVDENKALLNEICENERAALNAISLKNDEKLSLIIIPIINHKYDNLCLFLTIPSYEVVNSNLVKDLNKFANDMTLALIETRKFKKTIDASRFDGLTLVLNRKATMEKLENLISNAKLTKNQVAFAFIDIDDFKHINDKFGHDIGDDCLVFLSNQLRAYFNKDCCIGRFGGDEFIVLLNNIEEKEIDFKFNNLMNHLKENKVHEITLGISVGIAIATKDNDLLDVKKIMKSADISLYDSKSKGKNQYTFSK